MLRDLREGWSEFRSHTWLWVIVAQFGVILMAWYGGFQVLGPVVAKTDLGGPAAWGAITAAESVGLIVGGLVSLRFTPRRPMLFVVLIGAAIALSPLSLAMLWPLPVICLSALGLGVTMEIMMVQWTVALARTSRRTGWPGCRPTTRSARSFAMPIGALVAGPLAAAIGVSATQYGAARADPGRLGARADPARRAHHAGRRAAALPSRTADQATSSASPVNAAHSAA